jgi:TolA-binding protein
MDMSFLSNRLDVKFDTFANLATFATWALLAGSLGGCASAPRGSAKAEDQPDATHAQMLEMRTLLTQMGQRMEAMETRLGSVGDRLNATQTSLDNLLANTKAVPSAVNAHPSHGVGTTPIIPTAPSDPEAGFANDDAAQGFRKASILLAAQKYPEAVLAFSAFLEKFPDHALAGSAQYYVGESYARQKEYRLALREFERVLTSYDRSPHVADTLREMARAEDQLKLPEQAARHRQLLTSLFPQSPAAGTTIDTAGAGASAGAAQHSGAAALDGPPAGQPPTAPLESKVNHDDEAKEQ